MRKISEKVKEKALNMWLQGHTYREIDRKLGISIGAMSATVGEARKRAPDLDQLRKISVMLTKEGGSVPDAVRGARLLDKVNQLGVSLDRLGEFVELSNRTASEKGVGSSEFVGSALKLMSLEEETGKNYGEVIRDFEKKQSEIRELQAEYQRKNEELQKKYKGEKQKLEAEIDTLIQQKEKVKEAFEKHELAWEEGVEIVKKVSDLNKERERLKHDLSRLKSEIKKWNAGTNEAKREVASLKRRKQRLKGEVSKLGDTYRWYTDWLPQLEARRSHLAWGVDFLEKQEKKMRGKCDRLQGKIGQLEEERTRAWENFSDARDAKERIKKVLQTTIESGQEKLAQEEGKRRQIIEETKKLETRLEQLGIDVQEKQRELQKIEETIRKKSELKRRLLVVEAEDALIEGATKLRAQQG